MTTYDSLLTVQNVKTLSASADSFCELFYSPTQDSNIT
jgi:hypothetical protein